MFNQILQRSTNIEVQLEKATQDILSAQFKTMLASENFKLATKLQLFLSLMSYFALTKELSSIL